MTKILMIGLILASVVIDCQSNTLWNDAKQTIKDIEDTVENTCLGQDDCFLFSYCDLDSRKKIKFKKVEKKNKNKKE